MQFLEGVGCSGGKCFDECLGGDEREQSVLGFGSLKKRKTKTKTIVEKRERWWW